MEKIMDNLLRLTGVGLIIWIAFLLSGCTRIIYYPIPVDMTFILEGYSGVTVEQVETMEKKD